MTEAEAQKYWREIIGDFIPIGPISPEDVRRSFIDRYAGDPTESILLKLKAGLLSRLNQPKPYQALLTGCRGSGKSSELMQLAREMAGPFFVVWFDAEASLNDNSANSNRPPIGIA